MLFWTTTLNTITKTKITNWILFTLRSADWRMRKQWIYHNGIFTTTRNERNLFEKFNGFWLSLEVLHELQKDDKICIRYKGKELKTTVKQRETLGFPRNYMGEHQLILPINII